MEALAPRVLHFSHDQLSWECREHRACEIYPEGHACLTEKAKYRDPFVDSAIAHFKSVYNNREVAVLSWTRAGNGEDGRMSTYYKIWMKLVETYSRTSLTNTSDKLIALSGIAKSMSTLIQEDTYIASMWRNNLEKDLLWYNVNDPSHPDLVSPRPTRPAASSMRWPRTYGRCSRWVLQGKISANRGARSSHR